jgi:UDP-N-acetylmuramate dehydrogenase
LSLDKLKQLSEVLVYKDRDLTLKSTLRLKAHGDLVVVKSKTALRQCLKKINQWGVDYRILGMGANQVLPPRADYLYLKLDFPFDKSSLNTPQKSYTFPASVALNILTSHAIRFGLKGWEVFTGIPATLGGAVFMNAGTSLGEIGALVQKVHIITPEGEQRVETTDNDSFSYRRNNFLKEGEVIFAVELGHRGFDESIPQTIKDYLQARNKNQPLDARTFGCMFKNHGEFSAGKFIDLLGLKGFNLRDAKVSLKHANFLENIYEADYFDVLNVMEMVKMELELQYGIEFSREVRL